MGEKCTPTILPGAIAALEQIQAWGVDNIAAALSTINAQIAAHLEQRGFPIPIAVQRCPHMFGAQLLNKPPENLIAKLKTKNLYVSQRGHALRIAPIFT